MGEKICLFFWPIVDDYVVCKINEAQLQQIRESKICELVDFEFDGIQFVEIYHSLEEKLLYWIIVDTPLDCIFAAMAYWAVLFAGMPNQDFLRLYVEENSLEDHQLADLLKNKSFFMMFDKLKQLLFNFDLYSDFSIKAYFPFIENL